jgi:hypothetical protein
VRVTSPFSVTEAKVLKIIGSKKMTIAEITEKLYEDDKLPLGANNRVASVIRRINQKCEYHKLSWFLNGVGAGRAGRTIWKDKP